MTDLVVDNGMMRQWEEVGKEEEEITVNRRVKEGN